MPEADGPIRGVGRHSHGSTTFQVTRRILYGAQAQVVVQFETRNLEQTAREFLVTADRRVGVEHDLVGAGDRVRELQPGQRGHTQAAVHLCFAAGGGIIRHFGECTPKSNALQGICLSQCLMEREREP